MNENCLLDSLSRYIGQTVTIYTISGGCSGCGFTGVLAYVGDNYVKIITNIGAAPSCPIGSNCGRPRGYRQNNNINWLGSVTEIPLCKIASFTHNAI